MSLPNAVQSGRRPSLLITWYQDGTSTPEDLTGATITGEILRDGVVSAITGTFTVVDGAAGTFRWDFSEADVAEDGAFQVQFTAAFASGQTPALTFITGWTVREAM